LTAQLKLCDNKRDERTNKLQLENGNFCDDERTRTQTMTRLDSPRRTACSSDEKLPTKNRELEGDIMNDVVHQKHDSAILS